MRFLDSEVDRYSNPAFFTALRSMKVGESVVEMRTLIQTIMNTFQFSKMIIRNTKISYFMKMPFVFVFHWFIDTSNVAKRKFFQHLFSSNKISNRV